MSLPCNSTGVSADDGKKLLDVIEKLLDSSAISRGECSRIAYLELKDGRTLRLGITDDDVAVTLGLWADVQEAKS